MAETQRCWGDKPSAQGWLRLGCPVCEELHVQTENEHSGVFCFQYINLHLNSSNKTGDGVSSVLLFILCFWQFTLLYLAKVPDCDGLGQKGPPHKSLLLTGKNWCQGPQRPPGVLRHTISYMQARLSASTSA